MAERAAFARATFRLVVCLIALSAHSPLVAAEADPPKIHSLGQPPLWKPLAGGFYAWDDEGASGGGAYAGIYRDLLPSALGIGVAGEAYLGGHEGHSGPEFGVRAVADLRALFLKLGVDHNFGRDQTSFLLSLQLPLRRGGILGRGTQLRLDWLPARKGTLQLGIQVPLEPHMGCTRPRHTQVPLPVPPRAAFSAPARLEPPVREALSRVDEAAAWVVRLNSVFWDDSRDDRVKSLQRTREQIRAFKALYDERTPLRPQGHALSREVELLHGELARAFGLAAGVLPERAVERGEPLAALARQVLLEDVAYPFNRLYGQFKTPDTLLGLAAQARERYWAELAGQPGLDPARRAAVRAVFDSYVVLLERLRKEFERRAEGDPRLTFLPFPLVLRPEQHDTRAEIDAILGRAQGTPFTRGNSFLYLNGQQFQRELQRMILATEDYHVLWLHDFDGVDHGGDPDVVGFYQAVEGYLQALTRRVREFARSGRLPVYLLLVDLYYYEANRGRLLLDLLEDPLGHRIRLPRQERPDNRRLQQRAQEAQDELRQAVRSSSRLQQEAARRGERWLRETVKVHVSVMNPSDLSFRTTRLVGYLPLASDNAIRDHRKIAFRDVSEADPARGEALFGGVSVGEQYTSETWEDRALLAAGPALLTLKDAARRYLRQNGFSDAELPPPLRPLPTPADYDARVRELEARGWTASALAVHNDRGFARKDASVATLVLYSLLPPGSLIVVPDSIWTSMTWASQLVGAALRGCHVYVIAPSAQNAPSAGFGQLTRSREVFTRFFEIQTLLGPEIAAAGGRLRTGLYTRSSRVGDMPARFREVAACYRRYGFLRDEFPVSDDFLDALERAAAAIEAEGFTAEPLPEDAQARAPKLHRKTQFFAGREALAAIARHPEVDAAIKTQIALEAVVTTPPEAGPMVEQDRFALLKPFLEAEAALAPGREGRSPLYLTVGSRNQDVRGAILDGEALYVVSGGWSLWAYADMFLLFGSTTWVESAQEMDRLLPPHSEWKRRIGRWLRKVI
jgi:hypothetical protein